MTSSLRQWEEVYLMKLSTILNNEKRQAWFGFCLKAFFVLVLYLILWQLLSELTNKELIVPPPLGTFKRFFQLAGTSAFYLKCSLSLLRILIGFSIGLFAGTVLAIASLAFKPLGTALFPAISVIKATPVMSFIVILYFWSKSAHIPIIVAALMTIPFAWFSVRKAIAAVDMQLLEMAQIFQVHRQKIWRRIYFPSVSQFLSAQIPSALGIAWKSGIAAEVLSNTRPSIGGALYESKIYLEITDTFAWTITVVLLSLLLEHAVSRFFRGKGEL